MAQQDDEGSKLVKLDDFEGELEDSWEEARGAKVRDKNGDEVGTVEDLYVYEDAEAVHLLKVDGGEHVFLIPVDAVTTASEDGVDVEQDKRDAHGVSGVRFGRRPRPRDQPQSLRTLRLPGHTRPRLRRSAAKTQMSWYRLGRKY